MCNNYIYWFIHETHRVKVLSWYTSRVIISVVRLLIFYFYHNHPKYNLRQLNIFIFGTFASAVLWGVCAFFMIPPENLLHQMIIIVIIAGVTAGGVQTLQANYLANTLYVITIVLPLCTWLFLQNGFSYLLLGFSMTTYLIFMLVAVWRGYKILDESLKLRYENVELIQNLSDANKKLLKSYHIIEDKMVELKQNEIEMIFVNKINEMLQSCQKLKEAYVIILQSAEELFSPLSGGLIRCDSSTNNMEIIGQWGEQKILKKNFLFDDCWALREGHQYIVNDPNKNFNCHHFESIPSGGYICLPQITSTGVIGMLILFAPASLTISNHQQQIATTFNEVVKLSLFNINLHEMLSEWAIHDPLTQLFNRRFLDEMLHRELLRTIREKSCLCVCMLDIDFFKNFNDSNGHDAGDQVLKLFGELLTENFRGNDIACRFGGEEFLLVLVNSNLSAALPRLEDIRKKINNTHVSFRDQILPKITVSIGVAEAPAHGSTSEKIIHAADEALYHAKHSGRDCIKVYGSKETGVVE